MARILAIDWDRNEVCVVSAQMGRQGLRIERAMSWREDLGVTPADAAEAGRRLRDRLKQAGLGGAPALVCLDRQRVILKEIRYPQVPANEEPALVRFQAFKDLQDAAEDVVLDYQNLGPSPQGDQQAMGVIVRREVVTAYQTLCRSAGLKLAGMAPRAIGVAGAAQRLADFRSASNLVAVLTLGEGWAELCVVQGRTLLFARSLAPGASLVGEVKRSLAVFAGTPGRQAVAALHVAGPGDTTALRDGLQAAVGVPVQPLDPLAREGAVEVAGDARGQFAGAVGMLQLWGQDQSLPINLVQPKQPRPPGAEARRRRILVAAFAAALFLAVIAVAQLFLGSLRAERDYLAEKRANQQERLKRLAEDSGEVAELKDWQQTTVHWLDEMYDLAARMDHREGFRVTRLNMSLAERSDTAAAGRKGQSAKDPYVGKIHLDGVVPADQDPLIGQLASRIQGDGHVKLRPGPIERSDPKSPMRKFSLDVDIAPQAAGAYSELLQLPPRRSKGGRP